MKKKEASIGYILTLQDPDSVMKIAPSETLLKCPMFSVKCEIEILETKTLTEFQSKNRLK